MRTPIDPSTLITADPPALCTTQECELERAAPDYHPLEQKHGGDLMEVADWLSRVEDGSLDDYDGFGYPVTEHTRVRRKKAVCPSTSHELPRRTTHVLWFNR